MSYTRYNLVEASDFNTLTTNFNIVWADYGQSFTVVKQIGEDVIAVDWQQLRDLVIKAANHQGLPILPMSTVSIFHKISVIDFLESNISALLGNRFNASAQGNTQVNTFTNVISWQEFLRFNIDVQFASHDAALYFFNAGGQVAINTVHPAGSLYDINQLIGNICNDLGTIWLSRPSGVDVVKLAGIFYRGVTKVGGGGLTGPSGSNLVITYESSSTEGNANTYSSGTYWYEQPETPYFMISWQNTIVLSTFSPIVTSIEVGGIVYVRGNLISSSPGYIDSEAGPQPTINMYGVYRQIQGPPTFSTVPTGSGAGGGVGAASINQGNGFSALNTTPKQLIVQTSDYVYLPYSSGSYLQITASYNSGSGTLSFEVLIDEVPGTETVNSGTSCNVLLRFPSLNNLDTNSWGTPFVSCNITAN